MSKISRRDFLILAATASISLGLRSSKSASQFLSSTGDRKPGIIVLLFDAMSARHLSLYGYSRHTTPNLERFARRATVFHSHYATGSFTTPGTSSILAGIYPWRHRAINQGGLIKRALVKQNIFSLIGDQYYRAGFAENLWADLFLRQFQSDIENHIPPTSFKRESKTINPFLGFVGAPDAAMIYYSYNQFFLTGDGLDPEQMPGSPVFGYLDHLQIYRNKELDQASANYPFGMPYNNFYYFAVPEILSAVADRIEHLTQGSTPLFGYFHLWSPHEPFRPRSQFVDMFPEISILDKPHHPLSKNHPKPGDYAPVIKQYDEYIADVDDGFGKLLDQLTRAGVLDNNYLVVTSDHGQLFERGEVGHGTPLLYDSVIHVPLMISAPGADVRHDIYSPTSAVDLLPTLLHIADQPIPPGLDGQLLPGFGGQEDVARNIFSMDAKFDSAFRPFKEATISMIKGNMKLIYYLGYQGYSDRVELYNLQEDVDELRDLRKRQADVASQMKNELLLALDAANKNL